MSVESLKVYQKSYALALEIHGKTLNFPKIEQLWRSCGSTKAIQQIGSGKYHGRIWQTRVLSKRIQSISHYSTRKL